MPGIYFGNMEKKSSIDWLIEKCAYSDLRPELWEIIKRQAKEMHMNEICDAHYEGQKSDRFAFTWDDHPEYWSSVYYDETYGNKNMKPPKYDLPDETKPNPLW